MKNLLMVSIIVCFSFGSAYGAEPEKEISVDLGGDKLEMVLIPAGLFMMGCKSAFATAHLRVAGCRFFGSGGCFPAVVTPDRIYT